MKTLNPVYQSLNIASFVETLKEAHLHRHYDLSISLFRDLWDFHDLVPDWDEYELQDRAELFRLAGLFLLDYGKSKNLPNYQERAKDCLGRAIELFLKTENITDAMDCRSLQAFAYYQEGAINEYLVLLEDAESYFTDKTNCVYLRIQANFLLVQISYTKISEALKRIELTETYVEQCGDLKTMVMFYTNCGIVFRRNLANEKSLIYFEKALYFVKVLNNKHYEALINNSLAMNLKDLERFDDAFEAINYALELTKDFPGHRANFLDTKAQIYFKQKDYDNAVIFIIEAIELFREGDDAAGLCEALWTRTKLYLIEEGYKLAFITFMELYQIIREVDSKSASSYLREFTAMFFYIPEGDFKHKVDTFKRYLVENSLMEDSRITKAAENLGINHRTLSLMINTKYSNSNELFEKKRKTRSDKNS